MPPPPPPTNAAATDSAATTGDSTPMVPVLHIGDMLNNNDEQLPNNGDNVVPEAPDDEETVRQRNAQLWESEWKLLDTFRRGFITSTELRLFLLRCGSAIPPLDLVRFLEMFGGNMSTTIVDDHGHDNVDGAEHMVLTKAGFLRFQREYTAREAGAAENDLDSGSGTGEDNEDEDIPISEYTARGGNGQDEHGSEAGDGAKTRNPQPRSDLDDNDNKSRTSRRNSSRLSSARDGIVVDRGVLDQSDESGMDDDDDGEETEAHGNEENGDPTLFDGGAEGSQDD
ncbi:hypothetical protein FI667_g11203, partial [Globisporangium splendens]